MWKAVRTTLLGGVLFLVPVVVIVVLAGEAFDLSLMVAEPIGEFIPVDNFGGVALANILAVLLIVLVCFTAGRLAQVGVVARYQARLDGFLARLVPGYSIAKSLVVGIAGAEGQTHTLQPVMVQFKDHAALAFEVERTPSLVLVFLPSVPNAWSGVSVAVEPDRVTPVDLPPHDIDHGMRMLGYGMADALESAWATHPRQMT